MAPPRKVCPVVLPVALALALLATPWLRGQEESTSGSLPGTARLPLSGDLSAQMHEAAHRDMDRRIQDSLTARPKFWHRDVSSPEAYGRSVAPNREHLKQIIGLVDQRVPVHMERSGELRLVSIPRVTAVRWTVLDGVTGEGLFLEPEGAPRGWIIAMPDAGQTPEQFAGLAPGLPREMQMARSFVEQGFAVIVPMMIDRSSSASGHADVTLTNQTNREWIHRQAYMMGRHLIGYEIQKVLAAVDWCLQQDPGKPVAVAGYGEGGLIAHYAAAVDERICGALVSGYFKSRQQTWQEPIDRNIFGLLREFGDAEIASLIAPRTLVIEHANEPAVTGPPPVQPGLKDCAAPGALSTPSLDEVRAEFQRLEGFVPAMLQSRELVSEGEGVMALTTRLGLEGLPRDGVRSLPTLAAPENRQIRQVRELENHVQSLLRCSDRTRDEFFLYSLMPDAKNEPWTYAQFPAKSPETFLAGAKSYRTRFWDEILGRIEEPLPDPQPRSRQILDEPAWTGHEIVLNVDHDGFAWGVLLLPKDLKPGEKRPVVVCQHGRNGVPLDTINAHKEAYHDFAARLVEQGFIVLAPHNLYRTESLYRMLSRKGNSIGLSMFSVILRHHEQWLRWLSDQPNVDPSRIAFYGLSYGGESAMRIPSLLEGYCLSICSGDFNDWTRKVASTDDRHSFMFTNEWEMPYFNMGSTFSYAELSYLIFPRPFMVERGHHDGVAPDAWVAYEFAKTRRLYAQFGLADRTQIEFFNGGHTINGQGTFDFLHRHLDWPSR